MGRALAALRRFARDRRAVAAVEFAFVAPIMLAMYFVTTELAQGIETNKKVARIGSMVADLITQQQTVTKSEVEAIMKIGGAIVQPYARSKPSIVVTAIEITAAPNSQVKVLWSRKLVNDVASVAQGKGTIVTVPTSLNIPGSFLVRVESSLSYKPIITWSASAKEATGLMSAFDGLSMKETYYLRPRMSSSITCSDC